MLEDFLWRKMKIEYELYAKELNKLYYGRSDDQMTYFLLAILRKRDLKGFIFIFSSNANIVFPSYYREWNVFSCGTKIERSGMRMKCSMNFNFST